MQQKGKQKHTSKHAHAWSEWKWSAEYNRYYCERINPNGEAEYEWADESVPRGGESVDQLAANLNTLGLDGTTPYDQSRSASYQGSDPSSHSTSVHSPPSSSQYTHDPHLQDSRQQQYTRPSRDKGKGKGKVRVDDAHYAPYSGDAYNYANTPSVAAGAHSQQSFADHPSYGGHPASSLGGNISAYAGAEVYNESPNPYYTGYAGSAGEDPEVLQAINQSRNDLYGQGSGGEPSYSATNYVDPGTYASNAAEPPETELTPRGTPTPRYGSRSDTNFIHGTGGSYENVDPNFVVEPSHKFQPGEVFKILWSEPLGQVGGEDISDVRTVNTGGNRFYVGYRRFIIVTTDESHHSTCVPILTYDRRGCGKRGVKANKHGIVYAHHSRPRLLKNEPHLGFEPVALEIDAEGETLAKESRVNYSKLVTIEHNVKVYFIGRIAQADFDTVAHAVNDCWSQKMHKSRRRK